MGLCEFEISLICTVTSRTGYVEKSCLKKEKGKRKKVVLKWESPILADSVSYVRPYCFLKTLTG